MRKLDDGESCDLWTDGLLCAYEYAPRKSGEKNGNISNVLKAAGEQGTSSTFGAAALPLPPRPAPLPQVQHDGISVAHWIPIGWARIMELVQLVRVDAEWMSQPRDLLDDDDSSVSVAAVLAPYWQPAGGPTWWCHLLADHPHVRKWLEHAQWLYPAVSAALRDESRLISDRMKHLYYEVPVRVAGGLLFELLGQSIGERAEENVPVVLRSWQAEHYLITAMHVKGEVAKLNVLGVTEVQDLVGAGGAESPKTVHEVIALLVCRLARWDDRLFRKLYFGAADEVELKFMNRTEKEDLRLLTLILNQEIRRLSSSVIRVKWSLHARDDIIFELTEHLRGKCTQLILKQTRQNTREMIGEQEAVRDRLFTIQDVMQSTVRAGLQDKSVRIQHNLAVIGGVGLLLSIATGLFGVNLDGIPGGDKSSYAFTVFCGCLALSGATLIILGMVFLGYSKPIPEDRLITRTMELQDLVKSFQQAAESHAKLQNNYSSPAPDIIPADAAFNVVPLASGLDTRDYLLIA